jgi:hypothetical protein
MAGRVAMSLRDTLDLHSQQWHQSASIRRKPLP